MRQNVRIYTGGGSISDDVYELSEERADHRGNKLILATNGEKIRVHPTRLLMINNHGILVKKHENILLITCPDCNKNINVFIGQSGVMCDCNKTMVNLDWSEVPSGPTITAKANEPKVKNSSPKKGVPSMIQDVTFVDIEFQKLKEVGELWTKSVQFDHPEYEVKAHVLIITTGNARKFNFNSYNGTWGKKSKEDKINAFISDSQINNKHPGFKIDNSKLDKEREKLSRMNYIKEDA